MGVSIGIGKPERAHERREEGRTLKCSEKRRYSNRNNTKVGDTSD